jgi:hypothetical protein
MDRVERKPQAQASAGSSEINEGDRTLLDTAQGRENDQGVDRSSLAMHDGRRRDVGAQPRSEVTAYHLSGEEETPDGLDETEESVRAAAEDSATGEADRESDLPVFERGEFDGKI